MNSLIDYKDLQKLGFSKKVSYEMIKQLMDTPEYKKSMLSKVIKGIKVPITLFVKKYPELKKEILEVKNDGKNQKDAEQRD